MLKLNLELLEQAYCTRDRWEGIGREYEALAKDEKGNTYQVTWRTREDWHSSIDDEASACDWDTPYSIVLMEKAE